MEQRLVEEVNELKRRVVMLEKIVTSLIRVEEVPKNDLGREERKHLERTLRYIREGKKEKFIGLEELRKKLGL